MAQITPTSTLYLCKNIPLDPKYNYTLDFNNETQQSSYFDSKIASEFDINTGYSYIRDSQAIKVNANIDDLLGINYMFYNNADKRYYAFITKKDYVNPNCTRIEFKIDVLQSFMFNYSIDESFIDREHQDRYVNNDPVYNLEAENLDIGKSYDLEDENSPLDTELWYLIKSKEPLGKVSSTLPSSSGDYSYDNDTSVTRVRCYGDNTQLLKTNIYCYLLPRESSTFTGTYNGSTKVDLGQLNSDTLEGLSKDPNVLSITPLRKRFNGITLSNNNYVFDRTYYMPARIYYKDGSTYATDPGSALVRTLVKINNLDTSVEKSITRPKPPKKTNISLNTDRSADPKLYTYPYNFLRVILNDSVKDYHYEDFNDTNIIKFKWYSSLGANGNQYLIPVNHKSGNESDKLIASNNDLDLRTDKWLDYYYNNKASINGGLAVSGIQTLAGVGLGLATGGIGLAVAGGQAIGFAGQIAGEMMKREDIKQSPDNLRIANSDIAGSYEINGLRLCLQDFRIRDEFYNKIFDYFYHYGYKCNNFKVPNTRSRYYFNYIKTIGANINTNIDNDFRDEIASIYDNGLTIWHYRDASTFKGVNNYNYENVEMTLIGG